MINNKISKKRERVNGVEWNIYIYMVRVHVICNRNKNTTHVGMNQITLLSVIKNCGSIIDSQL